MIIKKGCGPIFKQVAPALNYAPDVFEFVYFARPDTIIDGISVHRARQNMGNYLARTIKNQLGPNVLKTIDVVIPIPETSNTSALTVAQELGIPYCPGFIKNRYIFRTFIMPGQKLRQKTVRRKLHAMRTEFEGRNVLLVDDSIVRGTTSKEIVQMARDAGAKKVFFASCAPPIRYVSAVWIFQSTKLSWLTFCRHAHIYGIDLADTKELVAFGRTESEISDVIGADAVIYQTLPDLIEACHSLNPAIKNFEHGVFSGEYVTPVQPDYFQRLENLRGENAQQKKKEAAITAMAAGIASEGDVQTLLGKESNVVPKNNNGEGVKDRMDISIHNFGDYAEARTSL